MTPLRILNVCAEFVPLAKSGGLGDVTASLSRYLVGAGHDVVTVLPRYGIIPAPAADAAPLSGPHTVPYDELLALLPVRDGIPAIDDPKYISAEEAAAWMAGNEPVIAFEENGDAAPIHFRS